MIHAKENRSLRTPTVLLPYQIRWQEDDARVKVCEKSRRIGLSWDEASEDALLAASRNGMDVFYIGYNKDMAQEFISDCADWARHYSKAASEVENMSSRMKTRTSSLSGLSLLPDSRSWPCPPGRPT